ncbi:MBL fold metallo-hydrolase [Massilibacteroides sp.]|uniref:MBL fold metallo-hydrolase n=1 Tax=Massilibacteroides sp. TaxID=2034766 RepID=UPI00261703F7|nr:MBL fold metallo-hydrolase [Massilibacteroides sp.]MDD4515559.1 MBL fold metallo-hydrolase [Massilibacteroides sp.]
MRITFLGTGTSTGVPEIGCQCVVCRSKDRRDKRLRSSLFVEIEKKNLLIDCGPDFRCQMIRNDISHLDGVLITHEHYDHVGGLDDLRPFSHDKNIDIYAEDNVLKAIEDKMPYVFNRHWNPALPHFSMHSIALLPFEVAGIKVQPIRVMHGHLPILGYRINNMAYLTDVKELPEEEFEKLGGLDVLIVEALRKIPHPSHETIDEALEMIGRIAPKQAFLTHMSHHAGLHADSGLFLPKHVHFAYDGLSVELVTS